MNRSIPQSYEMLLSHRKNFLKRPMILITVIIFTVITAMMYIQIFLPNMSALYEISQAIAKFSNGSITIDLFKGVLPYCIFMTLIATVLWYIYIQSARSSPKSSPKAGLAILYIFSLIEVIIAVIAFILILAVTVFVSVGGVEIAKGIVPDINFTRDVIIIVLTAAFLTALFILLYPIAQFRFFSSLKGRKCDGNLVSKGCILYPLLNLFSVIFFVSAILSVFIAVPNLFGLNLITGSYISSLCSFLFLVILFRFMLCIIPLSYRSYVKRVNRMIF